MLAKFLDWLGPVVNAIRGHLNVAELGRVLVAAVVAGGGVLGLLESLRAAVGSIVVDPSDAAAVAAGLTLAIEIVRRLFQGEPSAVAK